MKSKIFSLIATLALAFTMASCHDEIKPAPQPDDNGQIKLRSLGVEVDNAENIINSSTSSRASIDLSDFTVTILKGETQINSWRYADMPELFTLPVGDYKVRVVSHEVQKAEWEHPLFIGEKEFSISNDQITAIGVVTCYLSNIKVSIKYDESLKSRMGDDVKVTVIANDEGQLVFTPDETRSGFFEALPGSSTLVAEFVGTIGKNVETLRHTITDVKAGQHRIITFKVKGHNPEIPGETGGISIGEGLYLDVDVEDVDLKYNLKLDEENIPDDRPKPEDGGQGGGEKPGPDDPKPVNPEDKIIITSETLSFVEPNSTDIKDAIVNILSENGIEHFVVKIESTNDGFISAVSDLMPLSFDLAYPGDHKGDFESIGFPTEDNVIGKKELTFDISQFVPLLAPFSGTHIFTLSITDSESLQVIKSITFKAN